MNTDMIPKTLREYADRETGYIYADEVKVLRAAADALERVTRERDDARKAFAAEYQA